jgi:hypothetical protein
MNVIPANWVDGCPYLKNLAEHHHNEILSFDCLDFVLNCLKDKLHDPSRSEIEKLLAWASDTQQPLRLDHQQCVDWLYISDYLLMDAAYKIILNKLSVFHLPQMVFEYAKKNQCLEK